jgi:tRNA threonylcarbamoyladenosine biosynthesis protein TsaE
VTPTVTAHVEVKPVGVDEATTVHAVVHAAFEDRPPLDPPAAALAETAEQLEARLASHGGLLARVDGVPAGALILDPVGRTMYLRRFGVVPSMQGHGVAAALIDAAVEAADGYEDITVVAREELPATIRFWERQGFREIRRQPPNVELRRPLRTAVFQAPDADAMRGLGRSIAGQLAPGDLIVLTGALGAGKTTFTQGLGAGLGVRGAVTSPTFVIARVHRPDPERGRVALVHADAYRLGATADPRAEIDDLDLDASMDDSVTVVEWGEGMVEQLGDAHLVVRIDRRADDTRTVTLEPAGGDWAQRLERLEWLST